MLFGVLTICDQNCVHVDADKCLAIKRLSDLYFKIEIHRVYAYPQLWLGVDGMYIADFDSMMTSSNGNIFRVTGHLCGEFTGPRWIPAQRPVTRSFDVFFDLRLNKRLSKRSWGWWFDTQSCPLWRHCNSRFEEICPKGLNWQWVSIASDYCLPRQETSRYPARWWPKSIHSIG